MTGPWPWWAWETWGGPCSDIAGFRSRRFQIVALFDNDPQKIGQVHEGLNVEPIEGFRKAIATRNISLALLCVPADAAQRVADQMVSSGIRGILNFAPVPLIVPPDRQRRGRRPEHSAREPGLQGSKDCRRRELRTGDFQGGIG